MPNVTLSEANTIAAAAIAKGREIDLKPLCVAVLDAGGHLVALQREDGASNLRPQIAMAKASGALGLGVSSRTIGEMAADRPTFIASLAALGTADIIPAAGGVILAEDGEVVGAVGVTGDTSDNDEICALAGAEAAGVSASR
jgi:uncharacterized protein GlcG (DUF336 family)